MKAKAPRVPAIRWYTPIKNQGQIVLVSYGYTMTDVALQRVFDQSDRSYTYFMGTIDWAREPEVADFEGPPCICEPEWVECEAPIIDPFY